MIGFCAICGQKIEVIGQRAPGDPNGLVTIQLAQLLHMEAQHTAEMKRISAFSVNVSLFLSGLVLSMSCPTFAENREAVRRFLAEGIETANFNEVTRQVVMTPMPVDPSVGIVQD